MAQSTYKVSYVERGDEGFWREFWVTKGKRSKEAKAAQEAGRLGKTEWLQASNLDEAIRLAQRKHPNCTIMREGSGRVGR